MTMVTMTLMMMSYGVKRLENLILAASPDVPAKAELSLCQLLTEAESVFLLCFVSSDRSSCSDDGLLYI